MAVPIFALLSVELPTLLPIVELAEVLLHVQNGAWLLCRVVANSPDSFYEGICIFVWYWLMVCVVHVICVFYLCNLKFQVYFAVTLFEVLKLLYTGCGIKK